MDHKASLYFLLFVIAVYFFVISPMLFSHGMFYDGVAYATLARNMAEGIGSLWSPQFTDTWANTFHDHPPLVFKLQSWFFQLFGDHHWVERFYSLLCYILSGFLTIKLWKQICPTDLKSFYWLPILLWITIPKMTWGVCNNLLENTLMIFVLSSLLFQLKGLKESKFIWFFIAGFLLFLGFLSKGPTSLFPLSLPFFYYLIKKSIGFSHLLKIYLVLLVGILLPLLALLLFSEAARESLNAYYQIQIVGGLGEEQSVNSRFYIVRRVFEEILTMSILAILLYLLNRFVFKLQIAWDKSKAEILLWTLVALSGVLPILISMKQSTFYVIPVFPLFSIVFALIIASLISGLLAKIDIKSLGFRIFKITSLLLLSVSLIIIVSPINRINRDKNKLEDIQQVIDTVKGETKIGIHNNLSREWSIYGYFYRYGHISLVNEDEEYSYLLVNKGHPIKSSSNLKIVAIELKTFDLYELISP